MRFTEMPLRGAWIIDIIPIQDDRGFFARTWARDEIGRRSLDATLAECSIAWNQRRGTIRGMHFQLPPFEEVKTVRCTRGAILDVVIDLRPESPTFSGWASVELTEDNRRMLYVPQGFAHGYQTLTDGAEIQYQMSTPYSVDHARGVRWNDPQFGITWPLTPTLISDRDRTWPDFQA